MASDQQSLAPVISQSTRATINGTNTASTTATTTNPQPTGNIPPDLATMSDNDLISYINPSCFDQGTFSQMNHCNCEQMFNMNPIHFSSTVEQLSNMKTQIAKS